METKGIIEQSFGLKHFYFENKPVVAVYEERLVKSLEPEALFEVKQYIVDVGSDAEMIDNYIALEKEDGQYQLFCYAKGKLNKGPLCENYINDAGGFIYKDFRGKWYRAQHDCQGATLLGKYDAGIWLNEGKKSVSVSYLTENGWKRRSYCKLDMWSDSYYFYAFKKKNGRCDLLIHYFNGVAYFYFDLAEDQIETLKATKDTKKLPESSERFTVMNHSRIRGKES